MINKNQRKVYVTFLNELKYSIQDLLLKQIPKDYYNYKDLFIDKLRAKALLKY